MKRNIIKKLSVFLMLICLLSGVIQVQSAYAKDSDFKYRVLLINGGIDSRDLKDVLDRYNGKDQVVKIPSGFRVIGEYSFWRKKNVETVIIPKSVTTIEESAFAQCTSLKKVVFEKGSKLKKIGDYAFARCKNLQTINMPDNVEVIGTGAFVGCIKLKEAALPKKIKKIGEDAFEKTTIIVGRKVTVSTQEQLNKALKDKYVTHITLKTDREEKISIRKGNYETKQLFIYAPKAIITNHGRFKKIYLMSAVCENGKWIESDVHYTDLYNQIVIKCKKASIEVGYNTDIKSISIEKELSDVTIDNDGYISDIQVKKTTNLTIMGTDGFAYINVKAKNCKINTENLGVSLKNKSKGTVEWNRRIVPKGFEGRLNYQLEEKLQKVEDDEEMENEEVEDEFEGV